MVMALDTIKGHQVLWNLCCKKLHGLGIKLRSSARTASVVNRAISPALLTSSVSHFVCVPRPLCVCGGQRPTSGVIPQALSTFLFETGSLIGLELTK